MDRKRKWQKLSSRVVYQTPYIQVREDQVIRPDGKEGTYSYLDRPLGVFIIAIDDKDRILFLDQHRYPIDKELLELPAGGVEGDSPLEDAKKELLEETGMEAKLWESLGGFYAYCGYSTGFVHVFLAKKLTLKKKGSHLDQKDEAIERVVEIPIEEVKKMIAGNKLVCGPSLAALSLFFFKKVL